MYVGTYLVALPRVAKAAKGLLPFLQEKGLPLSFAKHPRSLGFANDVMLRNLL